MIDPSIVAVMIGLLAILALIFAALVQAYRWGNAHGVAEVDGKYTKAELETVYELLERSKMANKGVEDAYKNIDSRAGADIVHGLFAASTAGASKQDGTDSAEQTAPSEVERSEA